MLIPDDTPTSCKISEKTIERFLRKRVPDARTHARTDGTDSISPSVYNRGPISLVRPIKDFPKKSVSISFFHSWMPKFMQHFRKIT